jgi:hypothetical protein
MTMLTHTRGVFERAARSSARPYPARTAAAKARRVAIRRLCRGAVTILAAGGVLTAIIARKAVIYLLHFNH